MIIVHVCISGHINNAGSNLVVDADDNDDDDDDDDDDDEGISLEYAAIPYNEALKKNGRVMALKYTEKKANTTTKYENKSKETANEETKETKTTNRRKRRITWFNPPYSKNVSSNIGKKFFDLLNSCFTPNHKLHKVIKNTVKLSYSCMPNIKQIISSHNKRIIKESSNKTSTTKLCNCRDKPSCPLQGKCLEQSLVYQAAVSETNTNKIDTYIGITENTFKTRFNQHTYVKLQTTPQKVGHGSQRTRVETKR
ncbi:LOW QUALITY PROTEIN: hypothetical protein ElyMa_001564700 [Elysia marginata]|uniref:Uncharacterized protein n=1 Tax=Elysia marginata TaxID=1093978 RepID=A0AAV4JBP3_9GAST|nr:LOW QUALITY PROTEIN: hypothetical protein ElyMa_001564700 [Elysia marginata]